MPEKLNSKFRAKLFLPIKPKIEATKQTRLKHLKILILFYVIISPLQSHFCLIPTLNVNGHSNGCILAISITQMKKLRPKWPS